MTRMCSHTKISKGGAGSVDELRDSGLIIMFVPQLFKDQNFCENMQCRVHKRSCGASKTCCFLFVI